MAEDRDTDRIGPAPPAGDAAAPDPTDPPDPTDASDAAESEGSEESERVRAEELQRIVLHKSVRRERARRRGTASIWTWMGTFGLIGWTVAVPTLLGIALGVFLDNRIDSSISFTITFLVVGLAIGVSMAWFWVRRESQEDEG